MAFFSCTILIRIAMLQLAVTCARSFLLVPATTLFINTTPMCGRLIGIYGRGITTTFKPLRVASSSRDMNADYSQSSLPPPERRYLIHWKGEIEENYSFHFRHAEFEGALRAVGGRRDASSILQLPPPLEYENALKVDVTKVDMRDHLRTFFEESMQYIVHKQELDEKEIVDAAKRTSLIHAVYKVVSIEDDYDACAESAIYNESFDDMYRGGEHEHDTWCVRVRSYGDATSIEKVKRHGARARSMEEERKALQALTPLLDKLGGDVNLKNPDCKIYLFEGLSEGKTVLARRIARGPQVSIIAPATRICITTTPLCPISSFNMLNIAGVAAEKTVLDPYAGSCTLLLAAAMMAPTCRTVGIEVAPDKIVNRDNIVKDFETRDLTRPLDLICGDSTHASIRDRARSKIGNDAFDVIVTDPPYGIRESANVNTKSPLSELLQSISQDRIEGKPLLKLGGMLVAFVPCRTEEETIECCLPTQGELDKAGLEMTELREQVLREKLSRWLVAYRCTK